MASGANKKNTTQKRSDTVKKNNSNRSETNNSKAKTSSRAGTGSKTKTGTKSSTGGKTNAGTKTANTSRSQSGKPASSTKAETRKKQEEPVKTEEQKQLGDEVRFLLAIGVTILITMCNFHLCLGIGEAVYFLLHGFFGCMAYILPFLLLGMYLFILSNRGNVEAKMKVRLGICLFLLCCCLIHVVGIKESQPFSPVYYYMAGQTGVNGGLVGGLVSGTLQHTVGTGATILIIVMLMLVNVILLTEHSVVRTLQKNASSFQTRFQERTSGVIEFMQQLISEDERYDDYEEDWYEDYGDNDFSGPNDAKAAEANAAKEEKKAVGAEDFAVEKSRNSVWNWKGSSKKTKSADFLMQKIPFLNDDSSDKKQNNELEPYYGLEPERRFGQEDESILPVRHKTAERKWRKDNGKGISDSPAPSVRARQVNESSVHSVSSEGRPGSGSVRVMAERDGRFLAEMGFEELLKTEAPQISGSIDDFIVYNGLIQTAALKRLNEEPDYEENEPDYDKIPIYEQEPEEKNAFSQQNPLNSSYNQDLEPADLFVHQPKSADQDTADHEGQPAVYEEYNDREQPAEGRKTEAAVDVTEHVVLPEDGPIIRDNSYLAENGLATAQTPSVPGTASGIARKGSGNGRTDTNSRNDSGNGIWKQDADNANRGSSGAVTFGGKPKPREKKPVVKRSYVFPPANLLKRNTAFSGGLSRTHREIQQKLYDTLQSFSVRVNMGNISVGPTVTRYELEPEPGVKVSRIVALQDDIKLALAASDIRIEAPIPGKSAIGIEVPNHENTVVGFRELIESEKFRNHSSKVAVAVGRDISGQIIVADLAKMPHLLIAGATGSGKSVCINTLIMSIIYKASPEQVKLVMVDPKVVELSVYNGIPHLLVPVVTDARKAANALRWAVDEMNDRYKKFAEYNVRNLEGYNEHLRKEKEKDPGNEEPYLYQMVIIVDELADLMMVAQSEVEEAICRLAQMARAAGIHLVLATQRPSVNVITGLIKANVPSRIAFAVSSGVDSRTIIDMNGAEKLLGKGDMLFYPYGLPKPIRVQGAFISDEEVSRVVTFLHKNNGEVSGQDMMEKMITSASENAQMKTERDEYFERAACFIIEKDKASIGALQRNFKIGFNRAARLMDQLAAAGVVGEEDGTKPRKILMNMEEFNQFIETE